MKKILLTFLLLLLSLVVFAQDFGIWYEVDGLYQIDKVEFRIESALRINTDNPSSQMFYAEPGVVFNFNKYFSSGLYYRYIEQYNDSGYVQFNRWSYELNGRIPMYKFEWHIRYRLQEQSKGYHEDLIWFSSLRIMLDYHYRSLRPYVSTELFTQHGDDYLPDRCKYILGLEYKIGENHIPAIEYIRYDNFQSSARHMNILSLKYTFVF